MCLLDHPVVGGGVGDRTQHGPVRRPESADALVSGAQACDRILFGSEPALALRRESVRQLRQQSHHQVVAVAEVVIERRAPQAGPVHQGPHLEVTERTGAQKALGRRQNLSLGLFRAPAPAPGAASIGAARRAHGLPRALR